MLIAVWAMDPNGLIGAKHRLPWKIPEELEHFRRVTLHQTILMGRKTYEHLPVKPLPMRINVVATTNQDFPRLNPAVQVVDDLEAYIKQFSGNPNQDLYVCGGAAIYQFCWPYLDRLIVSMIRTTYNGDVYFPPVD